MKFRLGSQNLYQRFGEERVYNLADALRSVPGMAVKNRAGGCANILV